MRMTDEELAPRELRESKIEIEENYLKSIMLVEEEKREIVVKSAKGVETIVPFS